MKRVLIALVSLFVFTVIVFAAYGAYFFATLIIHINNAADCLPQELKMARQAGINADPSHFQQTLPPARLNAAIDYDRLTELLKKHPFTSNQMVALSRLDHSDCISKQSNIACKTVAQRGNLMKLVYAAVSKPDCVFEKDWTHVFNIHFSELKTLRTAYYLLRAESLAQERRGQWKQAIKTQTMGFKLARDAGTDPIFIALIDESDLDYDVLIGMRDILRRYANNPLAVQLIHDEVSSDIMDPDLKKAVQGEIIMAISSCNMVVNGESVEDDNGFESMSNGKLADANMAITLKELIPLYKAACLKLPRRTQAIDNAIDGINRDMNHAFHIKDITWLLSSELLVPLTNYFKVMGTGAFTERSILLASTAVLEYHAKHGAYPASLDEIAPETLHPFRGNPVTYRRTKQGFIVKGAPKPMDIYHAHLFFQYP